MKIQTYRTEGDLQGQAGIAFETRSSEWRCAYFFRKKLPTFTYSYRRPDGFMIRVWRLAFGRRVKSAQGVAS